MKTIIGFEHYGDAGNRLFTQEGDEPLIGEEVRFAEDLSALHLHDVLCEVSHGANTVTRGRFHIEPPFHYLGKGREKVMIRADVRTEQECTKMAVGLAVCDYTDGRIAGGSVGYRLASRLKLPTYPFYGEAVDQSLCFMPDLTREDAFLFTTNTRSVPTYAVEWIRLHTLSVKSQLEGFAAQFAQMDDALLVSADTYFLLFSKEGCRIIFGDFDAGSFQYGFSPDPEKEGEEVVRGYMNHVNLEKLQELMARLSRFSKVPFAPLAPVFPRLPLTSKLSAVEASRPEGVTSDSLGAKLWDALVTCEAGTGDPRVYYANFFAEEGLSLDEALAGMDPRVRDLFDINVRGFLGEDV